MIKTITIGDRAVDFKITASFALRYQSQFGEDILQKLLPTIGEIIEGYSNVSEDATELEAIASIAQSLYSLQLADIQRLVWVFAKSADESISDPIAWYDEFEEFPLFDILKELVPAFISTIVTKKKVVTQAKTEKKK